MELPLFGFALPSASSCYLGIARKRSLLSVRYSVPPRRSVICKLRLHYARWQRRLKESGAKNFHNSYATPQAPQSSFFASLSGWIFSASALNNRQITQARCAGKPQPDEQTEIWAAGSWRMRKHPSKVSLVLFVHKENSTIQGKDR